MKNLFVLLLLFVFGQVLATDTATFDIYLFGNKVGEIVATREKRPDGSDYYRLMTKARAKVLWIMRNQSSTYDVVYKDGKMLSSKQWAHDNDDTTSCNVTRSSNGISAVLHNGKTYSYKDIPEFSIVSLYFNEPKEINHFFDETEGVYVKIASTAPGQYEFRRQNGDKSVYRYVDGLPDNMEFHTSIVSVKIKRRK